MTFFEFVFFSDEFSDAWPNVNLVTIVDITVVVKTHIAREDIQKVEGLLPDPSIRMTPPVHEQGINRGVHFSKCCAQQKDNFLFHRKTTHCTLYDT